MNRKENRQINFRVNESEYQRIEQMAKDVGMSVPNFCKKKAQGSKVISPKINKEGAMQIAKELRSIGSNVNQMAKHMHQGKSVDVEQFKGLQKELHMIWQRLG